MTDLSNLFATQIEFDSVAAAALLGAMYVKRRQAVALALAVALAEPLMALAGLSLRDAITASVPRLPQICAAAGVMLALCSLLWRTARGCTAFRVVFAEGAWIVLLAMLLGLDNFLLCLLGAKPASSVVSLIQTGVATGAAAFAAYAIGAWIGRGLAPRLVATLKTFARSVVSHPGLT
jgi:putative Mn2+ efflux pump MntP